MAKAVPSPTKTMPPQQGPALLIVDDDEEVLSVLRTGLGRAFPDARIYTMADPREALRLLELEPVDVILTDERMTGMSGVELLIAARRVAPGAGRIMLTAFTTEELLIRDVNEARISCFFAKPFQLAEVVAGVRRTLDEQQAARAASVALLRAAADDRPNRPPVSPRNIGTPFRGPL